MRHHVVVAAAIVSAAFVGGVGPAGAIKFGNSLIHNALVPSSPTHNALEATGSPLDELNGVAVEAVVRAEAATEARGVVDEKSGHGSDGVAVVADSGSPGVPHVGGF
jgi:hypothetical protein